MTITGLYGTGKYGESSYDTLLQAILSNAYISSLRTKTVLSNAIIAKLMSKQISSNAYVSDIKTKTILSNAYITFAQQYYSKAVLISASNNMAKLLGVVKPELPRMLSANMTKPRLFMPRQPGA